MAQTLILVEDDKDGDVRWKDVKLSGRLGGKKTSCPGPARYLRQEIIKKESGEEGGREQEEKIYVAEMKKR